MKTLFFLLIFSSLMMVKTAFGQTNAEIEKGINFISTQTYTEEENTELLKLEISEQINGNEYAVKKLSTENNELYGSVKPTEIAKLIQEENKVDIKPSMIQPVEVIKSLGKFKVKISKILRDEGLNLLN